MIITLEILCSKKMKSKNNFLKILSYNVNGLKSFISKGGLEYILSENPDIFCLQETKIKKIIEIEGYYCIFSPGIIGAGVCVFSKIKPIESFTFDMPYSEKVTSKELAQYKGRIIICKFKDFILFNVYSPHCTFGKYSNLKFRLQFDSFLSDLIYSQINTTETNSNYSKQNNVIVLGDFNVANEKIDLKNANEKLSGFTIEERLSFKKIIFKNNLIDTFRKINPNKIEYSFFSNRRKNNIENNNGMRLDYILTNFKFKNSTIEKVYFSDHLPLILKI